MSAQSARRLNRRPLGCKECPFAKKGSIMKKEIIILIWTSGIIIACNSSINYLQQQNESIFNITNGTLTEKAKSLILETEYIVIAHPNPENDLFTDIYIRSISSEEEIFLITLENVNREHYHLGEYHNGNLYIIKKIRIIEEEETKWQEELWKYDVSGIGIKLSASIYGLDFRVAPDEQVIAVQNDDYSIWFNQWNEDIEILQTLYVYQTNKSVLKGGSFGGGYMYYYTIQLDKWSDNGQKLWGELMDDTTPGFIFLFDRTTNKVSEIDITHQNIGIEFELNANNGKLIYSNFPRMASEEEMEIFITNRTEVKLFLFDLLHLTQKIIATSIAKEFHPKWINDTTIEYDDPVNEGNRIVLTES
jgi:hypothetical protein